MKKIFYGMLFLGFSLASCNNNSNEQSETTQPSPSETKTIPLKLSDLGSSTDLVCEMQLSEDGIADTANYEGKIYGFCASECKAEFLKEPSKYLHK